MRNYIFFIFLSVFFLAACSSKKESPFNKLEEMLLKDSVELNNSKIIFYSDNSCEVCYQSLEYYVNHMPSKDFLFLYFSPSHKISYEQTVVKKFVSKEQFRLLNDKELFDEVAKKTDDYKGIYIMEIDKKEISSIKPVSNF